MKVFFGILLALGRMDTKKRCLLEAMLKPVRITKHPWLVACDADMSPADFEKSLWFQRNRMHVVARRKLPRAGQKSAKGEWNGKVYGKNLADGGGGRL